MTSAERPLRTFWLQPGATIRRIINGDPEYGVFVLTVLAGVSLGFADIVSRSAEKTIPLGVALSAIVLGGPVRAFVHLHLGGWLLSWIGRWLGGTATPVEVRAAIAWSNLPLAFGWLGIVVLLGMDGENLLERGFVAHVSEDAASNMLELVMWAESVLVFWSYLLLALGLAAVQGFGVWRATVSMIAVWVLIAFPVLFLFGDHGLWSLAGRLINVTASALGLETG